jgi:hypothetical protein
MDYVQWIPHRWDINLFYDKTSNDLARDAQPTTELEVNVINGIGFGRLREDKTSP